MPLSMKRYLIAMDPGQKQDPAAIQVYKAIPELVHPDPLINRDAKVIYRDVIVMQYKLSDKRYTYLADFVIGLMSRKSLSSESVLVFDATGVGAAVKDMLHERGVKDMIPIVYTAGGKESYVYRDSKDKRFQLSGSESRFQIQALDEIRVPKVSRGLLEGEVLPALELCHSACREVDLQPRCLLPYALGLKLRERDHILGEDVDEAHGRESELPGGIDSPFSAEDRLLPTEDGEGLLLEPLLPHRLLLLAVIPVDGEPVAVA